MDEMEKALLEKVVRRRDLLVRSIQRVCTNIETMYTEDSDGTELGAARIDKEDLERKMTEFQDVQSQIELEVTAEELGAHEAERTRIETLARSARIVLVDFIAANTEAERSLSGSWRQSIGADNRSERKVKRPEIQIPTFEGDYRKWNDFKNVFESLVVNEKAYTNVEKLVYLKQAVQKSAADTIKKFELTDKNFEKAWTKLKKRYENRRATINNHLQSLTQLPAAKNESGLPKLLDAASDAIESLDAMGVKDGWSYMVSYLVTEKLDSETRKDWELETVKEIEYPKFEKLEAFLQQRVRVIEAMGSVATSSAGGSKKAESARTYHTRRSTEPSGSPGELRCFDCEQNHMVAECKQFAARTIAEKTELIKRKGLCFQCLCKGHMVLSCRAARCSKCGKRHHVLLHTDAAVTAPQPEKSGGGAPTNPETKKVLCASTGANGVYLPTALVLVSQGGEPVMARAYLDSCSEVNLVAESLAKRLRCRRRSTNVRLQTAANGTAQLSTCCQLKVQSRHREFSVVAEFQVAPRIAEGINVFDFAQINVKQLAFADDASKLRGKVELLIGAEYFENVMLSGKLERADGPCLRETEFGWVAIGAGGAPVTGGAAGCYLTIQEQLEQFFAIEEVGSERNAWTAEELRCDEHFESTYIWDDVGFELELPKGLPVEFLGDSRFIAFRQFVSLERRLSAEAWVEYKRFMDEYIHLGHMTLMEEPVALEGRCFLPHHAVYKESSTTTKLRSVFNASCPTSTGYSLNDVLMKGPVLQDDLFAILVRFRCWRWVFTADVAKMYRQVRVKKEDRRLQCILWREKPSEPIRTYELNTVTYGTKPASYLATKCLRKIAERYDSEWPETAEVLRRDFYMDDVLTGGSSLDEVRTRLQELRQSLESGGFPLRKFSSNSPEVLKGLERDLIENGLDFENSEAAVGALGMRWTTMDDRFVFYTRLTGQRTKWTKREILSEVSKIFDPLGLLAPITVMLKMVLQSLWVNQVDWDDHIEGELLERYLVLRNRLNDLPSIHIPRFVGEVAQLAQCELHVFCDASEKAYGAAVYVRSKHDGEVVLRLLCAKTRVAPVKMVTLPRLELCGSVLAAKLFKKVSCALKVSKEQKVVAWTDSTIVLSWLAKPEHAWCTFVANRVTQVTEVLPSMVWRHVRSQDNAADVISRGSDLSREEELYEFLNGPNFLLKEEYVMPTPEFDERALQDEKRKKKVVLSAVVEWASIAFDRYSSWNRAIHVFAYVLRFVNNCVVENCSRERGNLTPDELREAQRLAVRVAQRSIEPKRLEKLDCFLDPDGIWRLRGRLANAPLSEKAKHPILLPKGKFLNLLIEYLHVRFFHANCLFLRNFLSVEYFVLCSLNRVIRSACYRCVTCRRFTPNLEYQIPVGQLPAVRVTEAPAFVEIGVDFAGPFSTRAVGPSGNRGKVIFKSYVAVYVCMVTRACHLELVEDLSSKSFLDSFSRMIARRGLCANVYSDNGTNFVGADRELKAAYEMLLKERKEIECFAANRGIGWHFIPQRAPNFGGLWEAAVKSFKYHFKRVVGNQILSYAEMSSLLAQIEAVLNSRPLCASDSIASSFVSPAHLCIGRSLMLVPELPGEVVRGTQFVRYKLVRGILDRFWTVWHREYLVSLRKATLSVADVRVPLVGELVLIKDEACSPCDWPVARIVQLFPGNDGVSRVADVRVGSKVLRRPIIKLIPLLPESSSQGRGGC